MATLLQLQQAIADKLGYSNQAGSLAAIQPVLTRIINTAQGMLYNGYNWPDLIKEASIVFTAGVADYPYPADCDPTRIIEITFFDGTGNLQRLYEGIRSIVNPDKYSVSTYPIRFERRAQLKVYPVMASGTKAARLTYYQKPTDLVNTTDSTIMNNLALQIYATYLAMLHFSKADSAGYGQEVIKTLNNMPGVVPTGLTLQGFKSKVGDKSVTTS